MKSVFILIAITLLRMSDSFAYDLSEINLAYIENSELKSTKGSFSDAINLLKKTENANFRDYTLAINILISVRNESSISANQLSAINAAIDYANDKIDELNQNGF